MKVACVGGGPAGLYFSILMKRRNPAHDITVHERNPAGATHGWGVTYWTDFLGTLRSGDPESAATIRERSRPWRDGVALIGDRRTVHPGDEGLCIGRQELLDVLAERARALGVRVEFGSEITDTAQCPDADLVVAGDGVNSRLRERYAAHFGPETGHGRNKYIWLGTTKVLDSFTFAFVDTPHGWIWCYAYGYSAERSTCIVECSPDTWRGLGLHRAAPDEARALLERLFARLLDGHRLIGRSPGGEEARWLNFRTLTNRTWSHGNLVLIGDAAHTTHYSIGAGTTLAMEDAVALADCLHRTAAPGPDPSALARYERERRAALLSTQSAARYSAQWYENLPRYMRLPPPQMFALLGQRHSPLLPHIPPQLYYRVDRAIDQLEALRRVKRWLGPRIARTVQARAQTRD